MRCSHGAVLRAVAILAVGSIIAATIGTTLSCGRDKSLKDTDTSTQVKLSFKADINPILIDSCGLGGCHGRVNPASTPYVDQEAKFVADTYNVKRRLGLPAEDPDFMPRSPGQLEGADLTKLMNFLDQ